MVSKYIALVTLAAAACLFIGGANAQLVPTACGFPTIVQTGSSVGFVQDTANALDYQNVNIDFGGGIPFCPGVAMAFPSISQTSLQVRSATHTEYSQSNEFAEFAYPFAGVGAACIPGCCI